MENVFGQCRKYLDYQVRKGSYAVIFNSEKKKVLTVQNSRGHYFLPGGGIEKDESFQQCLERELLEETGYGVSIGTLVGNAKKYFISIKNEPILSDGYFYLVELLDKKQEPIEEDHFISWIDIDSARKLLVHEHHYWAIKEAVQRTY